MKSPPSQPPSYKKWRQIMVQLVSNKQKKIKVFFFNFYLQDEFSLIILFSIIIIKRNHQDWKLLMSPTES